MNRYWTLSGKPLGSWPEADTFVLREGPTSSVIGGNGQQWAYR
jgi:hypothetical protein